MSFIEQNKKGYSPLVYGAIMVLVYGLGVPLTRILEAIGLYPPVVKLLRRKIAPPNLHLAFGDYQPTQHDVLVCSYSKSGTNWMMQMAYQIAFQGQGEFEHIHDVIPWPDAFRQTIPMTLNDESVANASPTGLRVIKTHLDFGNIPYTTDARYICVVRDPKDVLVSSYVFVRAVLFGPMMPTIKSWLKAFLTEDGFILGSWAAHVHSCWQVRDRENVLFLTFEQLKADQPAVIRQVADFMGVKLTPETFKLVDEKSHFKYMKRIGHKFDPPQLVPWSSPKSTMLRKGKSGASSELLTKEQQHQIDAFFRSALQQIGSDFPYDDMFVTT